MDRDVAAACTWLDQHTHWTDTVLAPTDVGQFVPAWAGNRVVYGHPFETIEAKEKEAEVDRFFTTGTPSSQRRAILARYGVRYVLLPRPMPDLEAPDLGLVPVWNRGDTTLLAVEAAGP
jgi:uncharacterized membrane protein